MPPNRTTSPSNDAKRGQGYNDARGEIDDKKDIPKHNGQNVNNDPAHWEEKESGGHDGSIIPL